MEHSSEDYPQGIGEPDPVSEERRESEVAPSGELDNLVRHGHDPRSTRTSRVWIGSVVGLIVLIAILVFILQNLATVTIHFPGATTHMPVGIAILFGVILGGLLVFVLSLARVLQLRRGMSRIRRAEHSSGS
ncbi:MAG: lipopolysaccharide assembly protein LapA domain-containing protein [Ferrimicrobium sp.]|jgi:uncharacterized integral membrane protein|nr:lipopolysaccharide assembly protein LapA domain-containing protein [Ferrimicrobium sp.]